MMCLINEKFYSIILYISVDSVDLLFEFFNEHCSFCYTNNPYNTRVVSGLPVGPICNSSIESVIAALEPAKTDYLYFYADVKTGRVYFAQNESEFQALIQKYKV